MRLNLVTLVALALFFHVSECQSENNWLCGACRIMNHEIAKAIDSADDTKTTVVGSFRVDPKGNQKTVERKFKRSQLHIHDVMESICGRLNDYGLLISAPAGKTETTRSYQFVSIRNANGEESDFVDRREEVRTKLKNKCEDILEEHEDWIESFFSKEVKADDADRELCLMRAGYCKINDLVHHLQPPPIQNPKKEEKEDQKAESNEEDADSKSEL